MATLSTHTLSSVDGTHAGGVPVMLIRIDPDGTRTTVLKSVTDDGGRLSEEVDISQAVPDAQYEMTVGTAAWFADQNLPRPGTQIVSEIVIRFSMHDPDGGYHIPLIIGPNGYSTWWSS